MQESIESRNSPFHAILPPNTNIIFSPSPPMELPYIPALVAALAQFIIGMMWYSPFMFGDMWMKLSGITKAQIEENMKKGMAGTMLGGLLSSIVTALVLAYFLQMMQVMDAMSAVKMAALLWLGFNAPVMIGGVLWEGKPCKLFVLQTSYYLVTWCVMGAIIGAWA